MKNWKEIVGGLAPTLGSAFGGPLGTMAGRIVAGVLGIKPDAKDSAMAEAVSKLTPEQLTALKNAEHEFQTRMAELGIDLEKLNAADRASARDMQKTTRSWVPDALAVFVHVVLAGLLWAMFARAIPEPNKDAFNIILGMVGTGVASIWGFYYGSSSGSQAKDALLGRAAAKS